MIAALGFTLFFIFAAFFTTGHAAFFMGFFAFLSALAALVDLYALPEKKSEDESSDTASVPSSSYSAPESNDEEAEVDNALFTITPSHELANDGTTTTGKVEYCEGAAHKLASLSRCKAGELELEINETEI
jgi:hypothetical protein